MEMELLLEYITLSSKLIKFPRHKCRLAALREALRGASGWEVKANENAPYPYTADEIKKDFDQRVYDGTAQRTPW